MFRKLKKKKVFKKVQNDACKCNAEFEVEAAANIKKKKIKKKINNNNK